MSEPVRDALARIARAATIAAAAGALLLVLGAFLDLEQLLRSYLVGWLYVVCFPLGCLAVFMLHHQTGGRWGFAIRRPLEAGMRTLPVMTALFLPIALGAPRLFPWADAEVVAGSALLQDKAAYLNLPFWYARAALYFVAWNLLAWRLLRLSRRYDEVGRPRLLRRERYLSALGLVVHVFLMIFASLDWAMSLDPEWYSTVFNGIWTVGQALSALCIGIVFAALFRRDAALRERLPGERFVDLGNLVLAFTMLWAYMSYAQYLIIWSGNLPEETKWYLHRPMPGWGGVAIFLFAFHFGVPFLLLLQRSFKRDARALAWLALLLLFLRFVDTYYMTAPAWQHGELRVSWLDAVAPLTLVAVFVLLVARSLRRGPLIAEATVRHPPYAAEGARA